MCSFHPWAGQLDLLGGCRAESIRTPGDREVVPELSRLVWSQPRPHWTGTPMAPVTLPPGTRNPPMAPVAPCSPTSHLTIPKPPCCNLPAPGHAIKCSINLPGGPDTSTIALKYIGLPRCTRPSSIREFQALRHLVDSQICLPLSFFKLEQTCCFPQQHEYWRGRSSESRYISSF